MSETNGLKDSEMDTITSTDTQQALAMSFDGFDIPVREIKEIIVKETGFDTDVRLYLPEGEGPHPVVFFIHGGAFVGGFNVLDEGLCRKMCHDAGVAVISPNYQLAPQYQWPVALNELHCVLKYFVEHSSEYGLDFSRLAIGGSSAGGNHATALCVQLNEEKKIKPKLMILVYPTTDLYTDAMTMNTSENDYAELIHQFVPEGEDLRNPKISANYADPAIFPKTLLFSGREDALWKEGKVFADRLIGAGVETLYKCYAHMGHGFLELAGYETVARDTKDLICREIRSSL